MGRPDDMEELAAEFALGTLSAGERQEAESLIASDAEFAGMVKAWERRLIPLALALEPVEAPPRVRGAVMRAIAGDAPNSETVVTWKRKALAWRLATAGTSAIAASLAAFILVGKPSGPPTDQRYVAVLQAEGPGPAFLASIDRPMAASACAPWGLHRSLENPMNSGPLVAGAISRNPWGLSMRHSASRQADWEILIRR